MKKLTVVFPICKVGEETFILLGKKSQESSMPGILNGFGGKCEIRESPRACAIRELREESGISLTEQSLSRIGITQESDKRVYFYTVKVSHDIAFDRFSKEMKENSWFNLGTPSAFLDKMMPNDGVIIESLSKSLLDPDYREFHFNFSNDQKLQELTSKIKFR